jgi:hypothetical protein
MKCFVLVLLLVLVTLCGCGNSPSSSSGFSYSTTPKTTAVSSSTTARVAASLELQDWNWHHEYEYAIAEGQVKNTSNKNLDNIEAVITWYTADGTFITSDSALIEYNPILPGQTSPFTVYATYNPAMDKASPDFKFLMGGSIEWHKAATPTTTSAPVPPTT